MLRAKGCIRESVIPDIQVKILKLCLHDNENGVLTPSIDLTTRTPEYRTNLILQEVIKSKIEKQKKAIPITLRKKYLYQNSLKNHTKNILTEKFSQYQIVPITMRKHILYQECRAV